MRKSYFFPLAAVFIAVITAILALSGATSLQAKENNTRNYMLVFDMTDYTDQLREAVTVFFKDVFKKGDQLIIVTPARMIGFSPAKLNVSRKRLTSSILETLKTDINKGAARERNVLQEMERAVRNISDINMLSVTPVNELARYQQMRKNLAAIRGDYQEKLINFSNIFRKVRGDNQLIMFLQPQYRPIPDKETMNWLTMNNRQMDPGAVTRTFLQEDYKSHFDLKQITRIFRYASIRFHFLYIKSNKMKIRRYVEYMDNFGDLYNDFSKLSTATNGIKLTTARPSFFVQQIRRMLIEGKVEVEVIDQKMQ